MQCAALPPRYVFSALLVNNTACRLKVDGTYRVPPNDSHEAFTFEAEPSSTTQIPERLVDMGTWTACGHVDLVRVCHSDSGREASLHYPHSVSCPRRDYRFVVSEVEGKLAIDQPDAD